MTATTRGSPVGGNESQGQGQAPDGQSQPPLPQNQVSNTHTHTDGNIDLHTNTLTYILANILTRDQIYAYIHTVKHINTHRVYIYRHYT